MALVPVRNESQLLQKIANGCEASFAKLFYGYAGQISGFVQSLTNSTDLTEEIVQEVFTKVWIKRESLVSVERFDAYLFILTRNHTFTVIRNANAERKKVAEFGYALEEAEQPNVFSEAEPDYETLIERAITLLPQRQQQVFSLRRKGLKNPEIALKLDISGPSVIKYQQLALKAISKFVRMHNLNLILCLLFLFKNT
jgi:RNA polymerase sigma-70 factor (ECF subfamily)